MDTIWTSSSVHGRRRSRSIAESRLADWNRPRVPPLQPRTSRSTIPATRASVRRAMVSRSCDGATDQATRLARAPRHGRTPRAGKPYVLGENDRLRLACAAGRRSPTRDFWPRFAGTGRTGGRWSPLRDRSSPGEAVTATTLGVPPMRVFAAWRGDLLLFPRRPRRRPPRRALGRTDAGDGRRRPLHIGLDHPRLVCAWMGRVP